MSWCDAKQSGVCVNKKSGCRRRAKKQYWAFSWDRVHFSSISLGVPPFIDNQFITQYPISVQIFLHIIMNKCVVMPQNEIFFGREIFE